MKHKHAELIKAWAEGAEIEYQSIDGDWFFESKPGWYEDYNYRIKPEPKPDVVSYINWLGNGGLWGCEQNNKYTQLAIKLTRSGETGELIKSEVI